MFCDRLKRNTLSYELKVLCAVGISPLSEEECYMHNYSSPFYYNHIILIQIRIHNVFSRAVDAN